MKAVFITVRTGSSRLPNKALLKINDRHTIEYVIESAKRSRLADMVILCTTNLEEDRILCEIATSNGIEYYCGSVEDKLERWKGAALKYNIDFFVTADGDDLFCSTELMDLAFGQYSRNNSEFIQGEGLVSGSFTYGIATPALLKVCDIKDTDETEMMWVYFTETGVCAIEALENVPNIYLRDDIRMTLDYKEDFDFFSTVINHFGSRLFSTDTVLQYLDENKEVIGINYFLEDKWRQNQISKTKLELK
jgi:spore coat polysaccharide biosynthesis protein SpsF (cytidylyltransferase family)